MTRYDVVFSLLDIHCFGEDDPGLAEPYLWTVFFKLDGDTIHIAPNTSLAGTATVSATSGTNRTLGDISVGKDDTIEIPILVGRHRTTMEPIVKPNTDPLLSGTGTIGCVAILMERDDTPLNAIKAGYDTLVAEVQKELDALIPTLNAAFNPDLPDKIKAIKKRIKKAVTETIGDSTGWRALFTNMDDPIGTKVFLFDGSEIDANADSGIDFSHVYSGEQGIWQIRGRLSINPLIPDGEAPDAGKVVLG